MVEPSLCASFHWTELNYFKNTMALALQYASKTGTALWLSENGLRRETRYELSMQTAFHWQTPKASVIFQPIHKDTKNLPKNTYAFKLRPWEATGPTVG